MILTAATVMGDDMARDLLAEIDRVRLVAALGVVVFRARKVDAEWLRLLHKLSGTDTQVWVQQGDDSGEAACSRRAPAASRPAAAW